MLINILVVNYLTIFSINDFVCGVMVMQTIDYIPSTLFY